jgi:hypothetical protein
METLRHADAEDLRAGGDLASAGGPDVTPILGTWHNLDEAGACVVRLVLAADDERLLVRALGAGAPDPHDWGEVPATVSAASTIASGTMAFSTVYDFGYVTATLAAYTTQAVLVLDTLNSFHDSSGRPDYFTREFFHR